MPCNCKKKPQPQPKPKDTSKEATKPNQEKVDKK
jgi:hypothetical protein